MATVTNSLAVRWLIAKLWFGTVCKLEVLHNILKYEAAGK